MKKVLLIFTLLGLTTLIVSGQKPQLSFFNEMESKPLGELFKDTTIIPQLQKLHAEIRMGILDTGVERVAVIKQLNQANIPVVSWLLLPKEKGYWFHSKNGPAAIERYHQIRDWAKRNDLKFSGMGLDLELDINDITLAKEHKFKLLIDIIKRLYDKDRVIAGRKIYQGLIDEIRQDGFKVESYFVPFIRYENEKGNTALQQVSGFLDITTDKDIPMLYSSFMGNSFGLFTVLAKEQGLKAVALGSTGGGFDTTLPTMQWKHLEYDMKFASSFANEIHIFSLEGAVQKRFLSKINEINFKEPFENRNEEIKKVNDLKSTVLTVSSILSHPTILLVSLLIILTLIIWLFVYLIKKMITRFKKQ